LTGRKRGSVNAQDLVRMPVRKEGGQGWLYACGPAERGKGRRQTDAGGKGRPDRGFQGQKCRCDGRFPGAFSRNTWVMRPHVDARRRCSHANGIRSRRPAPLPPLEPPRGLVAQPHGTTCRICPRPRSQNACCDCSRMPLGRKGALNRNRVRPRYVPTPIRSRR
jgi:hypothetical protein